MKKENSKENSSESLSIYVIDIPLERINERDLSEKLHEKQDLLGINIRKDSKWKEGNIAVASFGAEEPAETIIWEINKTEQHAAKKLGQNNQGNLTRTESTKERSQANQAVK